MDNNAQDTRPQDISYYTFEAVMAREERHIRRLTIALIVAIIGIVVCNMAWLYAWTSYDYVDSGMEVSVDGGDNGNTSYIGTRGMIINGQDYGSEMDEETDTYKEIWK